MYATFLASAFRTLRFGLNEAHGKGQALQLNYLLDKGAFTHCARAAASRSIHAKVKDAVRDLTHDLMTLQAEGDRAKADAMLATLGVIRPDDEVRARQARQDPGGHRAEVRDGREAAEVNLTRSL